ncbi:chemotaxis protein CheW [Salisediminibacterium halotolerans]|uniref:Chemotaxis protein CheW n=1 Tax=Salisediminibacterium halotolerans TaxID=517425 RepID=A0A1H9Q6B6_9BACI|nr:MULTISPECIES: chemotaxis protein CheW [Salisediminibacterium]RLJ74198.1 purine-binding chemotaxis protein CheW [Actinophytocola xinjiangensis]RPE87709.1 purine-binding chemotaxis protein CheW [Salisediminibacterium halotolerans]TWG35035.1 purine-binding chemotaxis protein CheW [Salisediminibacterium halotolerans]SER56000.1 purine-binding chemotaxis protein CheW [Salisediminibacterium haloalkalitolerans]GEL06678.1 chemotaxis protein CheW [Salisediminibacterium halotolerans]
MNEGIAADVKVIVFLLKDEEYGVEVEQVRSIERLEHVTRVPSTPDFVEGVINLRGVVTPIIDLRKRFGIEEAPHSESTRVIIVTVNQMDVGLVVDSANDVIDIARDAVEPPPEVVGGLEAEYIRGVAKLEKRLLILLNLEKVLNPNELQELQEIEGTV